MRPNEPGPGEWTSIYSYPRLYDELVGKGPCEDFYRELARPARAVLELACGTGRLTLAMAEEGRQVHGMDISAPMLDRARAKAALQSRARDSVAFLQGDMRAFALADRYDFIFVSCNSLAHLHQYDDLKRCFGCIVQHLGPGGLLAFDIANPHLGQIEGRRWLHVGPNPATAIPVHETAWYDRGSQIRTAVWKVPAALGSAFQVELRLRQIFPEELLAILDAAGLELVARYGDFAGNCFSSQSLNQVCIARPAGAA